MTLYDQVRVSTAVDHRMRHEYHRDRPHLVDSRKQSQLESLFPDRLASLEPGCTHRKIGFDLVPILAEAQGYKASYRNVPAPTPQRSKGIRT